MAKRRHARRRRRRGFGVLYKLISVIVISVAIVAALTLFFKVDSVTVSGVTKYSNEEIVAASGVQTGDNLFLLNKYEISDAIIEKLPYVSSVSISRKLPDTLVIEVTDSNLGKRAEAGSGALIVGVGLSEPQVGQKMAAVEGQERKMEQLQELFNALEEKGMLPGVSKIDFSEDGVISMDYAQRFTVKFAYGADFVYKLSNLNQVIEQLEENEEGIIDLTVDGRANVIPR